MESYGKYFNRYKNIDNRTLDVISEVLRSGIFKLKFKKRFELLKHLNTELSKIYNIDRPNIKVVFGELKKEHKKVNKNEIILNDNLGVIYFLIRFYMIMQLYAINKFNKSDAINWSFSVLYNSEPDFFDKVFSKMIKQKKKDEEKIVYVDVKDINKNNNHPLIEEETKTIERRLKNKWYMNYLFPIYLPA